MRDSRVLKLELAVSSCPCHPTVQIIEDRLPTRLGGGRRPLSSTLLSARQSVAKTVFFAVANGAHCASTAAKLSGQCRPQPNGREGKKPRSYNRSKPACDHQLDKPVAVLVPIHLIAGAKGVKWPDQKSGSPLHPKRCTLPFGSDDGWDAALRA